MQFSLSSDGGLSCAIGIILTNFLLWQHMVAMQLRCISSDFFFLSFPFPFPRPLRMISSLFLFNDEKGFHFSFLLFIFDCSLFILNFLKNKNSN